MGLVHGVTRGKAWQKLSKASLSIGTVNQKVLPLPNSLSTPICPPCRLMIAAQMYRPKPSPEFWNPEVSAW